MSKQNTKNLDISSLVPVLDEKSETIPHNRTARKQLSSTKTVKTPELPENTSIFDLPRFPQSTRPIECTPADVRKALHEYATTIDTIDKVLKRNNIRIGTFYQSILAQYEEIRQRYLHARQNKAQLYGAKAQDIFEELPDRSEFYTYDKTGNKCLSTAGVRFLELRHQSMLKQAQIHETGSFVPASKQETINRSINFGVNLQGNLPEGFDLSNAGPEDMLSVLRTKVTPGKK